MHRGMLPPPCSVALHVPAMFVHHLRTTHGALSVPQQRTLSIDVVSSTPFCSCPRRPPSPKYCARSGRGRGRARDGRPRRTRFPCRKKNELSLKPIKGGRGRNLCRIVENIFVHDFHFTGLPPRRCFLPRRRGFPRTELQHRARGGLIADVVVHRSRQRAGGKVLKNRIPERPATTIFTQCRCDGGSVDQKESLRRRKGWTRRK